MIFITFLQTVDVLIVSVEFSKTSSNSHLCEEKLPEPTLAALKCLLF